MTSSILTAAPIGYDAEIIEVEADSSKGLPGLQIVGMGNKAVDEAKERVRSAIKNSNLDFPKKRMVVNLAPAEIPKDGAFFDLAIAISILSSANIITNSQTQGIAFVGELSLSGDLKPVKGILNIVEKLKQSGINSVILPKNNSSLASMVDGIDIFPASNLKEVFLHLKKEITLNKIEIQDVAKNIKTEKYLIDSIVGQEQAKRALEIAVAGRHNILFYGPPGTGKTMLAKAALDIFPKLSKKEIIEISKIHGLVEDLSIASSRPFQAPHHTASKTSIIGGGPKALPGAVSLAHLGVLFLDELPEYPKTVIESLRQPLEDREITITRAKRRSKYPANFMLISTMNPCPCGYYGDEKIECTCTPQQILNYKRKISGPMLDRIDIVVEVGRIDNSDILQDYTSEYSSIVIPKIELCKKIQHNRYGSSVKYNSSAKVGFIKENFNLDKTAKSVLNIAANKLNLSIRSYLKIVKAARTIADLDNRNNISSNDIAEALQYRQKSEQI